MSDHPCHCKYYNQMMYLEAGSCDANVKWGVLRKKMVDDHLYSIRMPCWGKDPFYARLRHENKVMHKVASCGKFERKSQID